MRAFPIALSFALATGCTIECKTLTPQFQLDIESGTGLGSMEVIVYYDGEPRGRIIDVGNRLDDGETSLVIELDPALAEDFEVDVVVHGYTGPLGGGFQIASATEHFEGSPDGCNRFQMELRPVGQDFDGGFPPPDTGVPDSDGGVEEVCDPICLDPECNLACTGNCAPCEMSCLNATDACNADCTGRTCNVYCTQTAACHSDCGGGGTCDVQCGTAGSCTARCQGNASCRLDCANVAGGGACSFTQCTGRELSCPDGSLVCNRDCP